MSEIYEYSGYITFAPLSAEKLQKARSLIAQDGDPMFEFYTIKNRGLYVQKGYIVREKSKQKVGQKV